MRYLPIAVIAALTTLINIATVVAEDEKKIYFIPDEVKCSVNKKDRLTYCTDLEDKPITGELHLYKNNSLSKLYTLQNGLLEGASLIYYPNGTLETEKPYKKGLLHGSVKKYYESGALESETPYVSGYKEGIAKNYKENGKMFSQMIYSDDTLNGEMRIYTPNGKTHYSFENEDGKLISGVYYYKIPNKGINMIDIPAIVIDALNHACLELQPAMTTSACAVTYNGPLSTCDEKWRRQNRKAVRKYLAKCESEKNDE